MKRLKVVLGVLMAVIICSAFTMNDDALAAKKYVKSIKVKSKATITIPVNKKTVTKTYKVTVKVKGKVSKKFTVKSSKKSVAIAKVSGKKIKVTAKKSGIAKITVKTKAKGKKGKKLTKKLVITVKKKTKPSEEGKITKKKLKLYGYDAVNGKIASEDTTAYFSSKYPDVPFVTDEMAIENFLANMRYTTKAKMVKSAKGKIHTYEMPMGTSVEFDYGSKMMIFSDYTSTLVPNGDFVPFNPLGTFVPRTGDIYKVSDSSLYHGGDPIAVTFAYNEVPMLKKGKNILIPLQTFSDFFMSQTGNFMNYNGKGIFVIYNNIARDAKGNEGLKAFYDKYWKKAKKSSKISSALAQVNYYELCNILEARYGLQAAHNIATFDEYLTRMGFKKKLLSTNIETIEKATQDISTMLFEDFHSGAGIQSVFLPNEISYDPVESPVFSSRNKKSELIYRTREKAIGEYPGMPGDAFPSYQKSADGKTVFITFDSFNNYDDLSAYKAAGYKPVGNPRDTIDLFAYALDRLQNEDKDVKNVVVDLSVNSGGAVAACGYAMDAICGQCNINIQNPVTWALNQCVVDYDLNFDGKYDNNDKSLLDLGKNVAVLISDFSFSSANLLPNALDQLDDRVLLMGQKSGGGACSVGYISTAVGSTMQISSENRLSTMKNGYIRDIDDGIAPDVYIPLNRMYDRDYINETVREKFGN